MPAPIPPRFSVDTDDEDAQPAPVDLDVLNWRYEELERAGYPVDVSIALSARPDVNLHDACDLLLNGASVSQALRILL